MLSGVYGNLHRPFLFLAIKARIGMGGVTVKTLNTMTPEQKLKWAIIARATGVDPEYPCKNVDELYSQLAEKDEHWDSLYEIREGEVETGLECPWSRHYESKAVAMQMPDGTWVGWTYWYGGGKHGNPEEIDWMDDAYDLECKEEERLVKVQTFTKLP